MSWFSSKKENNNSIEWQEIRSISELNEGYIFELSISLSLDEQEIMINDI